MRDVAARIQASLFPFDKQGVSSTDYFTEFLLVCAAYPDAHLWVAAVGTNGGVPTVSKDQVTTAALRVFQPYDDTASSRVAFRALRFVELGMDVIVVGDTKKPADWRWFEDYLAGYWGERAEADALFVYLARSDPRRAMRTVLLSARSGRARPIPERQVRDLARLERAIDDCLWQQQFSLIGPDEVTGEARRALDVLSGRDEWWARVTALHAMFRDTELFDPAAFRKLERDADARVAREAAILRRLVVERRDDDPFLRPLRDEAKPGKAGSRE